jgi:hypothetical protein
MRLLAVALLQLSTCAGPTLSFGPTAFPAAELQPVIRLLAPSAGALISLSGRSTGISGKTKKGTPNNSNIPRYGQMGYFISSEFRTRGIALSNIERRQQ